LCLAGGIDCEAVNVLRFVSHFGPAAFPAVGIEQVHETGANAGRAYQTYRSIHNPPPR
jgi:hypothetical protein